MTDDHDHEHEILTYADDSRHDYDETAHYPLMVDAMRELLTEKSYISANQIRESLEFMDSRDPELGARIVVRAWTDPDYKKRLLEDGTKAAIDFDIPVVDTKLIVVENTDEVHNVIVCTLCSCYPRHILGLPPTWYKSKSYRARIVAEPRAVLKDFGTEIADDVSLKVHDSNADMRYLVLPIRPEGTEDWGEEELIRLVNRDSMVGVSLARNPEDVA